MAGVARRVAATLARCSRQWFSAAATRPHHSSRVLRARLSAGPYARRARTYALRAPHGHVVRRAVSIPDRARNLRSRCAPRSSLAFATAPFPAGRIRRRREGTSRRWFVRLVNLGRNSRSRRVRCDTPARSGY